MDELREIVATLRDFKSGLDQRHGENIDRLAVTDRKIEEVIRRVDDLHKAFPDGDVEAHRRYHETLIRANEAKEEFWQDLRLDLAKKGTWVVIGVLAMALISYIKARLTS